MAISPYTGQPFNAGTPGANSYTDTSTTTKGPTSSTSVTNQATRSSSKSSSSESWYQNTVGSKTTTDQTIRNVVNKNMDDEAYGLLMQFLREQAMGGSDSDVERRRAIWEEIAANRAQRQGYSKEAAMIDSAAAASAQMAAALEQMLPAITAGVDSAGTSGSAMAALLSQRAAEQVSRNAAKLQLDAAISYGNVANQASGIVAELLKIEDKAQERFLQGLEIAKGAITSTTDVTNRTIQENYKEAVKGGKKSSSSSSSKSNTTTVQNITTAPETSSTTSSRNYDLGSGSSYSLGSSLSTPSSYQNKY